MTLIIKSKEFDNNRAKLEILSSLINKKRKQVNIRINGVDLVINTDEITGEKCITCFTKNVKLNGGD